MTRIETNYCRFDFRQSEFTLIPRRFAASVRLLEQIWSAPLMIRANLIAALTLLHPDLVHRAVLLCAMPVLDTTPAADLKGTRFLSVAGERDKTYGPFAPELAALLREPGGVVDTAVVARGHLLGDEDVKVVSDWLKAANAVAGRTGE